MQDDDAPEPPANRTIQIGALTDVQLVDDVPSVPSAAPPPLPSRRASGPSQGLKIGMTLAAIVAGILFALVIVHFAFPGAPPPPSTRTIRQVPLDDEMVIRAGDTTSP